MKSSSDNIKFLGTTNTPEGWWECKDGKPVWIEKIKAGYNQES